MNKVKFSSLGTHSSHFILYTMSLIFYLKNNTPRYPPRMPQGEKYTCESATLMTPSLASQLGEKIAFASQSCTTLNMRRFIPFISSISLYSEFNVEGMMGNHETSISHKFDKGLVAQLREKLPGDGNQDLLLSPGQLRHFWKIIACIYGEIEGKVATGLKNNSTGAIQQ